MADNHKADKGRLEASFWSLLSHRYPLTWWWWTGDATPPTSLLPEWSRTAFAREADEWRRLAKDTVDPDDDEVRHWGQFARETANRILAGSFSDAAEPLRFLNLALTIIALLDPRETLVPRQGLVESCATWLDQVQDVTAASFWRKTRMQGEAVRLSRSVQAWEVSEAAATRLTQAVDAYCERAKEREDQEPIPWAVSAHVSVDDWRRRRATVTQEAPIVVAKPVPTACLLAKGQPRAPALQEVVVPGLAQWWLRPGGDQDILFHGDTYDPSVALGTVLALWRRENASGRLTWALSRPPLLEGGLMMVGELLFGLWPQWLPVRERYLAQWLQRRRVLAVADAWLWLEVGEAERVLEWMTRYMPRAEALAVIPWMKSHPGYYVMSQRVRDVLAETGPANDWDHWVFTRGPEVPDSLYMAP